jgi:lactate racemase
MGKPYQLHLSSKEQHTFSLPSRWTPVYVADNEEVESIKSTTELIVEALSQEKAFALLRTITSNRNSRIAIIVDDDTRPTPVQPILNALFKGLEELGLSSEEITLVVACGTHLAMDNATLDARFGKDILSRYKIVQHNAFQPDLVSRELADGRIVKINPTVAAADVKIGISSILPHPMAGYGGGPKIVMPGVCNLDFIMRHHMKNAIHPQSGAGSTAGNPFHEDCMRIARQIGLDFSINCLYDRQGHIVRIVAGTLDDAFQEAVRECRERLGMPFQEKVDISITSSYPHTHGIQLFKGLTAPDAVTKPDGAVLMAAPLVTPIPDSFLECFLDTKAKSGGNPSAYVTGFMSQGLPFLPDKSAEYNMAMSAALRRPVIRTIVASSSLPVATAQALGFEHVSTIEEGLSLLEAAYPRATVAIFPSGGLVIPIPKA